MKEWGEPGTYLTIWDCGDDVCDCHQVQLAQRETKHGIRALLTKILWEGTFFSGPSEQDWEQIKKELVFAAWEFDPDFIQDVSHFELF